MDKNTLKVRFAPSPTGYLHIGGARTALFNYLLAKKEKGTFLLRIEDTDVKREVEQSYQKILRDLKWLNIIWDEGPVKQSDRLSVYKKYAEDLMKRGLAYKCYCTPEELQAKREEMMAKGITPKYDGTCRNLTEEEQKAKEKEGRLPCIRFKILEEKDVVVHDLVRGDVKFEKGFADDFVIMKSDGTPSYNFAVVIDDHEMGINLVMRGEEHLVNTPRQILLYEALGFSVPQFAHISMILAPDRSKMSKRHGTVAVEEYRLQGYLPEAIVNYIALLGWSPEGDKEIFTMQELIEEFSLERVAKNPAVYSVEKLKWINSQHIQRKSPEELLPLLYPFVEKTNLVTKEDPRLLKIIEAVKPRLTLLSDIVEFVKLFYDDHVEFEEEAIQSLKDEKTPLVLNAFLETLEEEPTITEENFVSFVKKIQKRSKVRGKKLYMPLRASLTGKVHGLDLKYVLTILTKEQMKNRIQKAMSMV